ncbi:MAG: DotU family type IV/VI secretion system protein [Bryobacterales bacterium]|nr:DotU family type IV/VI secretion system protein [Bryobacterales bacterium]
MKPEAGNATGKMRSENLALIFQEVLTAIVRLRSDRQEINDAESFRVRMREALKAAIQEARSKGGYSTEDIKMATLALVGFLDESVLNTRSPMFVGWSRKPLQEELFGIHMAGELFFQNVEQLLQRPDSYDLADLLEVYLLCLLLGFGGRYSVGGRAELQTVTRMVADKIERIRGVSSDPFTQFVQDSAVLPVAADPWVKRLQIAAAVCVVAVVLCFVAFKVILGSGADEVRAVTATSKAKV